MPTTERRIGRYVLHDPVGRGAMGIVYRAEDPLIQRTVAVKVLHATRAMTPQQVAVARERFRREAESAGSIDHPNIIRIFDVGEDYDTGEMYIVMEYVSGPSLESLLGGDGLEVERAVEIIGQIASGLDAAHAQGLIHRDVKPSNVLLTDKGTVKLVDFGITHVATSTLTQDMRDVGTPAYMSPEQVNGRTLDARADVFSLGVLSYEILAGRKPFEGTDAVTLAHAIAYAQPLPISKVNPRLPQALDAVAERALAKEPADRFASGREFHEALAACLTGAGRARSPARVRAWSGRQLAPWGVLGATALVALAFLNDSNGERGAPVVEGPSSRPAVPLATPVPAPVPNPVPVVPSTRPSVPKAKVTISLVHRVRRGRLVVSLDGAPILDEEFSKSRVTILQTTTWDPLEAPAGQHTLRARVIGEDGRIYRSDPWTVRLPRAEGIEFRIRFKGDALTFEEGSE
ncbi:MAG TPA: serine/threonine-protein kinase [Candidatus Polarisedimenticolaceae bacterium]